MRALRVTGVAAVLAAAAVAFLQLSSPVAGTAKATGAAIQAAAPPVEAVGAPAGDVGAVVPSYAPSPRPLPAFRDPDLGVHVHALWDHYDDDVRGRVFDELVAAGVRAIRVDIGWASLEEECRACISDWYVERLDRTVAQARHRGLEVLGVLWRTPSWAGEGNPEALPHDPSEYGRVAGWLAERYEGRIAAWELWNEPNLPDYFDGDLSDYLELVRAAAPAIHAADEAATVVLSGPANNDSPWLRGALEDGIGPLVDVVAIHPYPTPADDPPTLPDPGGDPERFAHLGTVLEVVERLAPGTPVWLTEYGWSSHETEVGAPAWEYGVTRAAQAQHALDALVLLRDRWPAVERAYWYRALDRDTGRAHLDNFGLLDVDGRPKPVLEELGRLMWDPGSVPTSAGD